MEHETLEPSEIGSEETGGQVLTKKEKEKNTQKQQQTRNCIPVEMSSQTWNGLCPYMYTRMHIFVSKDVYIIIIEN